MIIALFSGCGMNPSQSEYLKTVEQGIKTVPNVEEIREMFPDAPKIHYIEQLGTQTRTQPAHWNTVVWLWGRYELTYQILVKPDYDKHSIKHSEHERAIFLLGEIKEMTNEGRGVIFGSGGKEFFEKDWNKVVAAKGDFSVIGVYLTTNAPIAGIENYITASRDNTWAIKEK